MKIFHISIIASIALTAITIGLVILPSLPNMSNTTNDGINHALPDSPSVIVLFNGTGSTQNSLVPFEIRQGQNASMVLDISSTPTNIPITLSTSSHVGFTNNNGIDLKLATTKIVTPERTLLHISASKDATPNNYKIFITTNTTEGGSSLILYSYFNLIVKQ
ncbi:MAG: hypothetical protein KGI33_08630 [Thaumarchaeota archaeon]|nr:hypothetical protein [Nitrososphaerota archaeon]